MKKTTLFLFAMLLSHLSFGELPFGADAKDWTLREIPDNCDPDGAWGQVWNLYNEVFDQGKNVVLDFSTTWCQPCWDYHQTHTLQNLWDDYGPDGDNTIRVFFIESDCSIGVDALCNSSRNWTDGITYPIFDPGSDPDPDNEYTDCSTIKTDYDIYYFPTLYAVNAQYHTVWKVGKASKEKWESWLFESFAMDIDYALDESNCSTTIDLTVTGGHGQLSYQWSNDANSEDITVFNSGTYTVTVTDENGYFLTKAITVNVNNDNCPCGLDVNVDLSSNGYHTVDDMLQAMNLSSLDELCDSPEQFNIILGGDLILDSGSSVPVCFNGVNIAMKKNARIYIKNNTTLEMDNVNMFGCGGMWDKILVSSGSEISINGSVIKDGKYAVYAQKNAIVNANNTVFKNNDIGIYLSWDGSGTKTDLTVKGCTFTSDDSYNSFSSDSGSLPMYDSPLAGIYSVWQNAVSINGGSNKNIFKNLKNGILCYGGKVILSNAEFEDIYDNMLISNPGSSGPDGSNGINDYPFFNNGFAIKVVNGVGRNYITACQFTNVAYATGVNRGSLLFNLNSIYNANTGIIGYNLDNIAIAYNSDFYVQKKGVVLNTCFGGYISNDIVFMNDANNKSIGIEMENCRGIELIKNKIKFSRYAGILLQNSTLNILEDNIIFGYGSNDDYIGISLYNSPGNTLINNNMTGVHTEKKGIFASDSYGCTYTCNVSTNFKYGIHFKGICDNSIFKGNFMIGNTIDLVLGDPNSLNSNTNATAIGEQGDWDKLEGWGNKWTKIGSSTAHNSGTQEIINYSPFLVKDDPDQPVKYKPINITAAGNWFYNKSKKNLDPCGNEHETSTNPNCKHLIKKIMKIDTMSEMGDCVKVMWEYKYYKELVKLNKKGLLSAECKEFLKKQKKNTIIQVVKIGNAIDSIEQVKVNMNQDSEDKSQEGYKEGEKGSDSTKVATDSIRWVIDNTELVDSCLKVLNKVNKVRLDKIDSDTLSKSDIALLMPIAESCPNEIGEGVYWARGLLSTYTDRYYTDFVDCENSEINPRSANTDKPDEKLLIYPNPAMESVNIYVDLPYGQSGDIQIQDINGDIIYHKVIYNDRVAVGSYPTGIYFVKYKQSTGKEVIKKLVITKH